MCCLQGWNCALTDCDAKTCYDQFLPIILHICYSKMGLPSKHVALLCKALIKMQYHIVTSHGSSEQVSKTDDNRTIFEIGHGETDASPS